MHKLIIVLPFVLSGCVYHNLGGSPLPQSGPTMSDVYNRDVKPVREVSVRNMDEQTEKEKSKGDKPVYIVQVDPDNAKIPSRRDIPAQPNAIKDSDIGVSLNKPFSRTLANRVERLYPRFDNPDILVFIYPHFIDDGRVPIPGQTTQIPLLNEVTYMGPGENK